MNPHTITLKTPAPTAWDGVVAVLTAPFILGSIVVLTVVLLVVFSSERRG